MLSSEAMPSRINCWSSTTSTRTGEDWPGLSPVIPLPLNTQAHVLLTPQLRRHHTGGAAPAWAHWRSNRFRCQERFPSANRLAPAPVAPARLATHSDPRAPAEVHAGRLGRILGH